MRSRWTALLFVLVLASLTPQTSKAQGPPQTSGQRASGKLGQNSPNPFNPTTEIPFTVGNYPTCSEPSRKYLVSLTMFNTIAQAVAYPVLQRGSAEVAGGSQIRRVRLPCGSYNAYFDGKDMRTRKEIASGVYIAELVVDGQKSTVKMMVTK
jgi:hypothetical protein